ncbi:MAG TPA: acyl carrier protein [Polyangiaceae bacterium]|nr:acyl carrier protein [Polyangiaceae bacterium]
MSYAELRQRVIDWLDDNYHFGDAATLIKDDEASFLDNGVLESLGFVKLRIFLEKTYAIKVDTSKDLRKHFDSLGKIVRYVLGHKDYKGPRA